MAVKAVIAHVSDAVLAERRRTGLDRWDEMWDGVLHMAPAPNYEHQRILDTLIIFLAPLLEKSARGTLRSGINVFHERSPKENYRIPDLTFVARGRELIVATDGISGGAPDAVIEIRSPEDETYDKLPFFAALGVTEVIVIDRETKVPAVYRLVGLQYVVVRADRDGWVTSETLDLRLRGSDSESERSKLVIEDRRDPSNRNAI